MTIPYTKNTYINDSVSGPFLSATNLNKIEQGIYDATLYASDTGGDDTYVANLSASTPTAGMQLALKVTTANTGACTISINNGTTAISVKKQTSAGTVDPSTGDVRVGINNFTHDGTYWILQGMGGNADTVDGYQTSTTAVSGTIPVYDANTNIPNASRLATGSYTGNGANNRSIDMGLGTQPSLVYIWGTASDHASYRLTPSVVAKHVFSTTTFNIYMRTTTGTTANSVAVGLAINSTGIVTGNTGTDVNSCNVNTIVYYWEAWI